MTIDYEVFLVGLAIDLVAVSPLTHALCLPPCLVIARRSTEVGGRLEAPPREGDR